MLPSRTLLLAVIANLGWVAANNYFVWGTRKPEDILLFEYTLTRSFKPLQIVTDTVIYPMTPEQKAGAITQIDVNGDGAGDIHIKNGGVNQKFVQIMFQSARNRGLYYKIRIYGSPPTESINREQEPG